MQTTSTAPNTVLVTGSFLQWRDARQLQRDAEDPRLWTRTEPLPPGVHQYKFIVDGVWRHAPDQPVVQDERGILNNILTVNVELCGEGSCFCTRIYREINTRKSLGGGGADGSQANLPSAGAATSLLSRLPINNATDLSNRSGGKESSPRQRIALKGRTGVALEYKEKRRTSPEPNACQVAQPRSLAMLAGSAQEAAATRAEPTTTATNHETLVSSCAGLQTQASLIGAFERSPSDFMRTSQIHGADGAPRMVPGGKSVHDPGLGSSIHLDEDTPIPAKTYMHHDIDDAPFEATVVPDARELLADAQNMLPLENALGFNGERRSRDAISSHRRKQSEATSESHHGEAAFDNAGKSWKFDVPAEGNRTTLASDAASERTFPSAAASDDRKLRVMRLVSVATAESEAAGAEPWRKKSLNAPSTAAHSEAVDTDTDGGSNMQLVADTQLLDGTVSKEVTALGPDAWVQPARPPRRNAIGRDGDDVIPEGAMSRVSSLNEIRQQHAQLIKAEDESKQGGASGDFLMENLPAGMDIAASKTPMRPELAASNARRALLARPSSADSMVRLQRIPLELQYALRAEFSSPAFGFDPQSCHEDILLSTANQCARMRPQHSGLYRSVRGVLPVPPGSYFEVVFAPAEDFEGDPSSRRSVVDTKLPVRKCNSLFSSRVNGKQQETAAACVGIALDTEHLLLNALLGGHAGSIGLHTSGFVVRWNAHSKRPEWHRAVFHDGCETSSEAAVVPPGAVIGVIRTHSKQGVRFFVNGLEVVPHESQPDECLYSGGEWKCPASDSAVEAGTYKPIVSLFASTSRVYAAFSSDALHYASTATSSSMSSSSIDSSSSLCLQCLDGESVDLRCPPAIG
ncbi:hypothetical protein CCYA_CCYA20G4808 [Cyanidiococcus yangmingshanensis]|nr:hypothetical protein CCYA_CCYA20G4808 [Cyanidiococcus yangmingshanensis]